MPDGGRLVIECQLTNLNSVSISFADTGVGIPKHDLDKLFEPLFTTKAGGIGLGLAIVKMLVEAHNGNIGIWSEEGRGSTFTVHLPLG
jgi:signal transduction histidine kinase